MSAQAKTEKVGRRHFLKMAGISAATGGAVLAVGKDEARADGVNSDGTLGYRETDHVKTYYKLAAF